MTLEEQRVGPGSLKKNTQYPRHRGQTQGTETSAHRPCNMVGELRGLREAHTSLHGTGGRTGELPLKPLPSKLWLAVPGRTREQRHQRRFQGQYEAGGSEVTLRGPLTRLQI